MYNYDGYFSADYFDDNYWSVDLSISTIIVAPAYIYTVSFTLTSRNIVEFSL
jgi:hypothetical protein